MRLVSAVRRDTDADSGFGFVAMSGQFPNSGSAGRWPSASVRSACIHTTNRVCAQLDNYVPTPAARQGRASLQPNMRMLQARRFASKHIAPEPMLQCPHALHAAHTGHDTAMPSSSRIMSGAGGTGWK